MLCSYKYFHMLSLLKINAVDSEKMFIFLLSLFHVQRKVREGRMAGRDRREEAIFTRLRLGQSQLNKSLNVIGKESVIIARKQRHWMYVMLQCGQYQRERERLRSGMREKGIQEISLIVY